jgi:DNA-binding transcriptional MerR regulator
MRHEPDESRFSIGDLSREARVSARAIRCYIAEGLPPPMGSGRRAVYTRAHLDRLRLIGQMKNEFLPLREIRRRLVNLDEGEIRRLAEERVEYADMAPPMSARRSESARRRTLEIREEPSGAGTPHP